MTSDWRGFGRKIIPNSTLGAWASVIPVEHLERIWISGGILDAFDEDVVDIALVVVNLRVVATGNYVLHAWYIMSLYRDTCVLHAWCIMSLYRGTCVVHAWYIMNLYSGTCVVHA